jgi:hypothetical protein
LVGGGLAAAYLPSVAAAQGRNELDPERRRNFAALVDSLDRSPPGLPIDVSQIDPSRAEQAAQALARLYERETDLVRRNIDTILDALDRPGRRRGAFGALDRGARRDEVVRGFSETRGEGRALSRADENEELERLSASGDKDIADNEPASTGSEGQDEPSAQPPGALDTPLTGEGNVSTP